MASTALKEGVTLRPRKVGTARRSTQPRHPLKRLGVAACLTALSLAASASSAAASVTIGQLAPANPPVTCVISPFDLVQPTVASGNSYTVPALPPASALVVSSWSHNAAAGAGQMLTMKVFRKVADPNTYQVVGHDGPRPLSASALNTFPASIAVKAGDVLGLNDVNASTVSNACLFATDPGESHLEVFGDLADGASADFGAGDPALRINATAVVEPTNTFTLGAITRNKKKGTATLMANVPNPGELALSGNGVKSAGGAVNAPGAAELMIRAKGKKKRKLNETGKVKLKPKVTYTPTGGDPSTQSIKVKLTKKL